MILREIACGYSCGDPKGLRGAGIRTEVTIEANMKRALAIVDAAGAKGADVVSLSLDPPP